MLILSVFFVKSRKKGIFLVLFWDFPLLLKDFLIITMLWGREWAQNLYTCILYLILDFWTTVAILVMLVKCFCTSLGLTTWISTSVQSDPSKCYLVGTYPSSWHHPWICTWVLNTGPGIFSIQSWPNSYLRY